MYAFLAVTLPLMTVLWPAVSGSLAAHDDDANTLDIGAIFPIKGKGGWQGGQVSQNIYNIVSTEKKKSIRLNATS